MKGAFVGFVFAVGMWLEIHLGSLLRVMRSMYLCGQCSWGLLEVGTHQMPSTLESFMDSDRPKSKVQNTVELPRRPGPRHAIQIPSAK